MVHTLVPGIGISVFQGDRKADLGFGVHEAGDNSRVRSDSLSQGWGIGYQSMLVLYPHQNGGIVVMMNSKPGKPQYESLIGEVIRDLCTELRWPGL
jgi:hypothetical protein